MRTTAARLLIVCAICALFTAAFAGSASAVSATWTLTVQKTGPGTVTGNGIDCGTDCSETYSNNCAYDPGVGHVICEPSSAMVSAAPAPGYTVQWSGCDQVSGNDCTVVGGTSATVTASFVDTQAPSVAVTAPTAGVKHGAIALAANASDNVGVSRVDFYVRGVLRATDSTPPYSATFDTGATTDGSALVEAKAVDTSGNLTTSAPITITIDNTAPVLGAIEGPGAGPFGPGTTQDFSWTVSDATSGLASVRCKVDDGTFDACASNTATSYTDLPEGSHELAVRATDAAGNLTERSYAWTIDATAPAAEFTSGPADGSSSTDTSATFTFSATEPSSFQCRFYPAPFTPPPFTACTTPFSVAGLGIGTYVLEVMPVDGAGNAGAAIKRTFTVTAPPSTSTDAGTSSPSGTGSASGTQPGGDAGGSPSNTAPKRAISAAVRSRWSVKAGRSRAKLLKLSKLPARASVKVACKGRGCPFKKKRFKAKAGVVVLTKAFRKALAARTRITITITAAGMTGQQITFVTQKKKQPKRTTKALA